MRAFRKVILLLIIVGGWAELSSAAAQEGLFVDQRHRAIKASVQNEAAYDEPFQKNAKALAALIAEYEAKTGPDSAEVGALLLDIGELTIKRVEYAQEAEKPGLLKRGVRALRKGEQNLRPFVDRYEAGPLALSRALYYLGLGLKQQGATKEAEAALREGLTAHWNKYNDHAAQLKFFEPL